MIYRRACSLLWFGLALGNFALVAAAQDNAGSITVAVRDDSGAPIPNAEVKFSSGSKAIEKVNTDDKGLAHLGLAIGAYDLVVTSQGFRESRGHIEIKNGENEFQVVLKVASCPPGPCLEVTRVPIETTDVPYDTTLRKWGRQVKGVAVDVTLDKETYKIGEDIPLHIAMENFSADVPILSLSPIWTPCSLVGVEVRNRQTGQVLQPGGFICTEGGPGGLWRYVKGSAVRLEKSLKNEGLLPAEPGMYSVTVKWQTYEGNDDTCNPCEGPTGPFGLPNDRRYALVQATAEFRVVSKDGSGNSAKACKLGGRLPLAVLKKAALSVS
jgi:hypothetical protein